MTNSNRPAVGFVANPVEENRAELWRQQQTRRPITDAMLADRLTPGVNPMPKNKPEQPAAAEQPADRALDAAPADNIQLPAVVEATDQGYTGVKVDPTPDHAYTMAGQVQNAPTPETDAGLAVEAAAATGTAPDAPFDTGAAPVEDTPPATEDR